MSRCVINSLVLLRKLAIVSDKRIDTILKNSSSDLICALTEIFFNIYEYNISLTQTARRVSSIKFKIVKKLADRNLSIKKKRKLFRKYGPLLFPFILPSVLSQITENHGGSSPV